MNNQQETRDDMPALPRKTLAEWRTDRGYTQMRLAAELGMTLATIWNLEKGRNAPSWRTVQALADKFGIAVEQIVWPEVVPFPSKANRKKELTGQAA